MVKKTKNSKPKQTYIAEELAKEQRLVSVAEFFQRNRHLLGYDNPTKALLTVVKEGVDNAIDAAGEAGILPEVLVEIQPSKEENRFKITIEDNGPGIITVQIPKIFGTLLYGSKFHRLRQSRGIQGLGISCAVLYGQLTTGKASKITSKIGPTKQADYFELVIDVKKNEPEVVKNEKIEWEKEHGTRIEIEIEANYQKGMRSVDQYLKQTAIANPYAKITYKNPEGETIEFPRATKELPNEPKEIKPHPYGVELGILIKMLKDTKARTLQSFLHTEFCRVSSRIAKQICEKAGLFERARPSRIARQEADNLLKSIKGTKIIAPPTDCLSPIGEPNIIEGLKKEVDAGFYTANTRPPNVYRGFPFQVEAGIAYGGALPVDNFVKILRYANKVPLLYQQSSGAIHKSIINTVWRNYSLSQSRGALPTGPAVIMVHIASVWVPFTSESKESVAHYPEIIKEIKLALQECGRRLATHIRKVKKKEYETQRKLIFEKYMDEVIVSLDFFTRFDKAKLKKDMLKIAHKRTIGGEK